MMLFFGEINILRYNLVPPTNSVLNGPLNFHHISLIVINKFLNEDQGYFLLFLS